MLKPSWSEQLDQKLVLAAAKKLQNKLSPTPLRVALVGVGNELNGDDAAGNQVAAQLIGKSDLPEHFLPVNAGVIPENASGPLRRFQPDLVIFVDAADFGGQPGEIRWLEVEAIGGMSVSSHTLPLPVLGHYLESELGCHVEYLGIQPGQLELDQEPSQEVRKAIAEVVIVMNNRIGKE